MSLPSGASFAGYIVSRVLGSGVTGEVYLVEDPQSMRRQALKVLSGELSADPDFKARFREETPIVVNLHYPHIVEVQERGQFDGRLYVAMEYIEGTSAAQLMTDRFPAVSPADEVLATVTAVAGALDYAHLRGLTHRDVKPANILLADRAGGKQRILLTDFGIARQLAQAAGDATHVSVAYAAPEELSGGRVDGRADQYALAATAFHLLTGTPPVAHADPAAALRRHRDGKLPRLSDQRPELAHLDSVFAKALAERPEDRFETCHDFARAASELAGLSTGERPEPEPDAESDDDETDTAAAPEDVAATTPEPDVPRKRGPRKVLVGAAVVALVVGALVAGIAIGRHIGTTPKQVAAPTPTTPAPPPAPLDGSYRIEAQRTKQTYNYVADPQPPDVSTWWAFRSSCTQKGCSAAAMQLDDSDHVQAMSPGGGSLFMQFADGEWQSAPVDLDFPCVGPDGSQSAQRTTMVLALRPQPNGEFVGEEVVTVRTDECGQRSAVIRVPTVASRTGEVPPAVAVPEPGSGPQSPELHPPSAAPTAAPFRPQH
ncbi:serine/threonine-protein kinase [Mycobacterium colombiense]